jgi:hypothetical protein
MTSTFFALPLTSGEAFLLCTTHEGKEWVILVDSGRNRGKHSRELARILAQVSPTLSRIDVAICTHSDADHSNGFWHFADDWCVEGKTIGEFWLPGSWAYAMPHILLDPIGFAETLLEGSVETISKISNDDDVDSPRRTRSQEQRLRALSTKELKEAAIEPIEKSLPDNAGIAGCFGLNEGEFSMLVSELEETDNSIDPFRSLPSNLHLWHWPHLPLWKPNWQAWVAFEQAFETAKAIREIANSAVRHKIRVRWFDFGEFERLGVPSGGIKGLLEPVCAVEVRPKFGSSPSPVALFLALRLSRQNVESLVFYRPENNDEPAVLFLGDSRLAFGINKPTSAFALPNPRPTRNVLVTAPHHGSEVNDHAYKVMGNWLKLELPLYVRNGGQAGQKLGQYCQMERRCAQCVQCHGLNWRQTVEVRAQNGSWHWPPQANPCP